MKDTIIGLNDFLCYVAIIALMIVGFVAYSVIGAIAGFVFGAVLAGFWMVLSGIYTELKKITASRGL